MHNILFLLALGSPFELAGEVSAGLLLCAELNTKVSDSQVKEYREIEKALSDKIDFQSDNGQLFLTGQVNFINTFELQNKDKPLDEQILSSSNCQLYFSSAEGLINKL